MVDNSANTLQNKMRDALEKNLERIESLKHVIAKLESENDGIARQNDVFRKGAIDGIHMSKHIDEIHEEREKYTIDLADKAHTIKKLLDDNQILVS